MKKFMLPGIGLLTVIVIGVLLSMFLKSGSVPGGVEVDWRLLGGMDYISGQVSSELKAISGHQVKIPGFMVPLEDDLKEVTEFLLVPSPQACIHVPAPPPNQMVFVKMKKGTQAAMGPIWVYGKLNLSTQKSIHGDSSFELIGESVEPYR